MILLESLFVFPCFLLVAANQNGSVYSQVNNTVLKNATKMPEMPSTQVVPFNASLSQRPTEPLLTPLPNVNNSSVNLQRNDSELLSTTTTQVMNNSVSGDLKDTEFPHLHYSSYDENVAFFSSDFIERLRTWNDTVINASRHCIERKRVPGDNTDIYFPVFQAKQIDHEGDFLALEVIHPVLVRERSGHDLVSVAYLSILELWPLLVLCFSCAALSGMILWLLVSRNKTIVQ